MYKFKKDDLVLTSVPLSYEIRRESFINWKRYYYL